MLILASALGGTFAKMGEETPVGDAPPRGVRRRPHGPLLPLSLGNWPRSLAPGFLQSLMAAPCPRRRRSLWRT